MRPLPLLFSILLLCYSSCANYSLRFPVSSTKSIEITARVVDRYPALDSFVEESLFPANESEVEEWNRWLAQEHGTYAPVRLTPRQRWKIRRGGRK